MGAYVLTRITDHHLISEIKLGVNRQDQAVTNLTGSFITQWQIPSLSVPDSQCVLESCTDWNIKVLCCAGVEIFNNLWEKLQLALTNENPRKIITTSMASDIYWVSYCILKFVFCASLQKILHCTYELRTDHTERSLLKCALCTYSTRLVWKPVWIFYIFVLIGLAGKLQEWLSRMLLWTECSLPQAISQLVSEKLVLHQTDHL